MTELQAAVEHDCTVDGRPWPGRWQHADPEPSTVFLLWRHGRHTRFTDTMFLGVFGSAEAARECVIDCTLDATHWERSGLAIISKRLGPCREHAEWMIERRSIIDPTTDRCDQSVTSGGKSAGVSPGLDT